MKGITFFLTLYLLSCATHGGVYQWTDENGHVHFGSVPPVPQKEYSLGDDIKAAQQKPEQPVEKVEQTVEPDMKQALVKHADSVEKESVVAVRKVGKDQLDALIKKLLKGADEIGNSELLRGGAGNTAEPQRQTPVSTRGVSDVAVSGSTPNDGEGSEGNQASINVRASTAIEKTENATIPGPVSDKNSVILNEKNILVQRGLIAKEGNRPTDEIPIVTGFEQTTTLHDDESSVENENISVKHIDAEKCGLFLGFVEQYQLKESDGCPGPHCDIYKRQLEKFRLKEKIYCG